MTDTALPAPWLDREKALSSQNQLGSTVSDLKTACAKEHDVHHVTKCQLCYPKVLEAMQSLFAASDSDIYGQNAKIREDNQSMFSLGDQDVSDLKDARPVTEAKNQWYRSTLLQILDLVVVEKNFATAASLSALQRDPDNIDAIMQSVWKMLGNPEDWSENTRILAGKTAAAKNDEERRALCPIRAYRDEMSKTSDLPDEMKGRDLQRSKPTKSQRTTLEERMGEILRAKTAFEQTKAAEAKSRSSNGTHPVAGPGLETLPACQTCWKPVDGKDVLSCVVCQVAMQISPEKDEKGRLTVYCSEECYQNGQPGHIDTEHQCAAGDSCSSTMTVGVNENTSDEDGPEPTVCSQCLQDKVLTFFCSKSCGRANLAAHRQSAHETKPSDTNTEKVELLLPFEEVVMKQLEEANPRMQFTWAKPL